MASRQKKAIVRSLNGELWWGYLPASGFVSDGIVQLMEVDGRVRSLAVSTIGSIAYVKDFNLDDPVEPERMGRRSFQTRPRTSGLWIRLGLKNADPLEGLTEFDLGSLDSIVADGGVTITPPELRGNVVRYFVPRHQLLAMDVLGWVSAGVKLAKPTSRKLPPEEQPGLFEE
ncbi:MAG: hypothetical protein PW792_07695 [Acidobacteriaceae bacterium]|nr:hypothetical protein [Acidobacteriaceae bacterium]